MSTVFEIARAIEQLLSKELRALRVQNFYLLSGMTVHNI
jgi:hypothetical protein